MRPIKLKVWDKIDKCFAPIEEIHFTTKWVAIPVNDEDGGHLEQRSFDDVEIIQFTGLLDKNGVEIYEGDIVVNNGINWEIVWKDCGWHMQQIGKPSNGYIFLIEHPHSEVIGNIYENPELLK